MTVIEQGAQKYACNSKINADGCMILKKDTLSNYRKGTTDLVDLMKHDVKSHVCSTCERYRLINNQSNNSFTVTVKAQPFMILHFM